MNILFEQVIGRSVFIVTEQRAHW